MVQGPMCKLIGTHTEALRKAPPLTRFGWVQADLGKNHRYIRVKPVIVSPQIPRYCQGKLTPPDPKTPSNRAIVIGAGIGGLAAAMRLGAKGVPGDRARPAEPGRRARIIGHPAGTPV